MLGLINTSLFPSPSVWPSFTWPSFPTRKGTANAQEEQQAKAQLDPLSIATIIAALILAGGGIVGAAIGAGGSKGLDEISLQELADAQGPKKITGKVAGSVADGAVSGEMDGAMGGTIKNLAMDISELDSLLGNHQAIQQDNAKDILVDDLLFAAADQLGKTLLTQEQLKELFQLVQKMAPLIKG